ncbi:hypothetical protein [Pseudobacteriovorax antillogorgiicola]|uniref:Carboxypeptidase regulatory-like domain-containing protein n=1 Tax=Pseudobacteriovorax antillogorgiicola TaxID=1513793 RepID=A0A1Y6B3V7_9BACT|nr:hypothetical protein [Pseudobacteriovorax antillogorgiicola]TCS59230.1 hypothetical protein EDD56_101133 [Pseudobacteriovorax antillogorgiicola]SME90306.1 hypothetical protein SAMN06296036_101353 [Pseudobacteriovorax antillogorgiicola]
MQPATNMILVLGIFFMANLAHSQDSQDLFVAQTPLEIPYRNLDKPVSQLLSQELQAVETFFGVPVLRGQPVNLKSPEPAPETPSDEAPLKELTIAGLGSSAKLPFGQDVSGTLFVRDPDVVAWNDETHELESKSYGNSEVYIVAENQMTIVKVEVKDNEANPASDLAVDVQSSALKNILSQSGKPLSQLSVPYDTKGIAPSLRDSDSEIVIDAGNELGVEVVRKEQESLYKNIAIQVVDERSKPEEKEIYPVEGVSVQLVGSDFRARTNARGLVEIADVPAGGRFMVRLKDQSGRVLDQVIEVATEPNRDSELFRVRALSFRSYFLYSSVFGVAQRSNLASLCLRAMTPDGLSTLAGVRAEINVGADGPYYFNEFGPDGNEESGAEDGRMCFFNVDPGLVEVSFFDGEDYLSAVTIPLVAGNHLEDDIYLANGQKVDSHLVAMPSAVQAMYGGRELRNQFLPVDYTEMIAVGDNDDVNYHGPGVLRFEPGHTFYRGRLYGLVQGAEFETSLYSFDPVIHGKASSFSQVAPLLQRGFIEDLFNELYLQDSAPSIAFDPSLGSVFVRHGAQAGENLDQLSIRLVNHLGQDVQDPWFFGSTDSGFIKAVFFNLQPGIYTLIVESSRNHWVDATTIPVDYWLTTVTQTGAPLVPKR